MTTGHRLAALRLHGLGDHDREWILAALSDEDRNKVVRLLDELQDLGFSKEVARMIEPASRPAAMPRQSALIAQIDDAPPRLIASVLSDEQPATIAVLLGYHPWRWHRSVMRRLGSARRMAIERLVSGGAPAPAPKVTERLISTFAEALLRRRARRTGYGWLRAWGSRGW